MSLSGGQLLELVGERTDLGHQARNKSFLRQLKMLLGALGMSLPQAAGKKSKSDRRPIVDRRGMGYEYVSCVAVDPKTIRIS
jgi:hypothetical protein